MRLAFSMAAASLALLTSPLIAQEQEAKPVEEQIGAGGRPVGANWSRSPVIARDGMAATAHPLATQIALQIMKDGGNAVDAAIAANAALGLMEPTGNGIGGDLFAIVWDAKNEELVGLNASGRAPALMTRLQALDQVDDVDWSFEGDRLWARLADGTLQSWGTER